LKLRKAFSLIELLIATMLLTLLLGIALFSFRYILSTFKKIETGGFKKVIVFHQLETAIASMKYYFIKDSDILNSSAIKLHAYFEGNENSMKFISTNPNMFDSTSLIEIVCKNKQLHYKEEPLFYAMNYLNPTFTKNAKEKILMRNIDICRFDFKFDRGKELPSVVILKVGKQEDPVSMYVNILSDDNLSKYYILDKVYEQE
jgi:prepilin-type N-terminal cleavage/methylation domain-containing protein